MRIGLFAGVIALVCAVSTPVFAQAPAGRIKTVSGAAFIVRAGKTIAAVPG